MNRNADNFTPAPKSQIDSWEKQEQEFLNRLRASGRTVVEREPSDTNEFVVTFPQGNPPAAVRSNTSPASQKSGKVEFADVISTMLQDDYVKNQIKKEFGKKSAQLIDGFLNKSLSDYDEASLSDFLEDLLHCNGEVVQSFTESGSYGEYLITITGLGGAYFYDAPDFDLTGYFLSVEDAEDAVRSQWIG